jgi:hypothetical protein
MLFLLLALRSSQKQVQSTSFAKRERKMIQQSATKERVPRI